MSSINGTSTLNFETFVVQGQFSHWDGAGMPTSFSMFTDTDNYSPQVEPTSPLFEGSYEVISALCLRALSICFEAKNGIR